MLVWLFKDNFMDKPATPNEDQSKTIACMGDTLHRLQIQPGYKSYAGVDSHGAPSSDGRVQVTLTPEPGAKDYLGRPLQGSASIALDAQGNIISTSTQGIPTSIAIVGQETERAVSECSPDQKRILEQRSEDRNVPML